MRVSKIVAAIFLFVLGVLLFYLLQNKKSNSLQLTDKPTTTSQSGDQNTPQTVSILYENYDTPWALVFLPDKSLLVTERRRNVLQNSKSINKLDKVVEAGEGGLMGIALHPKFTTNNFVYLYYTYSENGANTRNRVVRMTYQNGQLEDESIIIDNIPGAANHNGGRIKFGPDGYLYITTGDAQDPSQAQDTKSLAGKILRVTDDGDIPGDNPFNNPIYSYGHRNPQGIAWDDNDQLWSTEHGRSGASSGYDELNLIKKGSNYGWPEIQGDETRRGMVTPVLNSGPSRTWAPGGMTFAGNSLFFVGLRGETLYEAAIKEGKVIDFKEHLKDEYGRMREIILGPDDLLYITTSNQDGRGKPAENDDKIIKVNHTLL